MGRRLRLVQCDERIKIGVADPQGSGKPTPLPISVNTSIHYRFVKPILYG